jgi:hypothetical protein
MPSRVGSQARRACLPAPSRSLCRLPSTMLAGRRSQEQGTGRGARPASSQPLARLSHPPPRRRRRRPLHRQTHARAARGDHDRRPRHDHRLPTGGLTRHLRARGQAEADRAGRRGDSRRLPQADSARVRHHPWPPVNEPMVHSSQSTRLPIDGAWQTPTCKLFAPSSPSWKRKRRLSTLSVATCTTRIDLGYGGEEAQLREREISDERRQLHQRIDAIRELLSAPELA